jgi:hypothetical protein
VPFVCVKTATHEVTPWLRVEVEVMRFPALVFMAHGRDRSPKTVVRRTGSGWTRESYTAVTLVPFGDQRSVIIEPEGSSPIIVHDDGSSVSLPSWLAGNLWISSDGREAVGETCWRPGATYDACEMERLTRFARTGEVLETRDVRIPPDCRYAGILFRGTRLVAGLSCKGTTHAVDAETAAEIARFDGGPTSVEELAGKGLAWPRHEWLSLGY